jgi:hypothetical protein
VVDTGSIAPHYALKLCGESDLGSGKSIGSVFCRSLSVFLQIRRGPRPAVGGSSAARQISSVQKHPPSLLGPGSAVP